jgi:hypothetical protein
MSGASQHEHKRTKHHAPLPLGGGPPPRYPRRQIDAEEDHAHQGEGHPQVSAAEALRRAQVAVYREPGRIKEWSQGCGPLATPILDSGRLVEKLPGGKTNPARAWAAFVISGPGD